MRNAIIAIALLGTAGYMFFRKDVSAVADQPAAGDVPTGEQSLPAQAQYAVGTKLRVGAEAIIADLYQVDAGGTYKFIKSEGIIAHRKIGRIEKIQSTKTGAALYFIKKSGTGNFYAVTGEGVRPYIF